MKIQFHPEAKKELLENIDYYLLIDKKLSQRFWEEFQIGIERIKHFPTAWKVIRKNCRRYLLNKFPYAIIYRIKPHVLEIIAVMHLKRKPDYWRKRIH